LDQIAEGVGGGAEAAPWQREVGSGDVAGVAVAGGASVEQERAGTALLRTAVVDVVQDGGVRPHGDDVLVGGLGIVLARRLEILEVEIELGQAAVGVEL